MAPSFRLRERDGSSVRLSKYAKRERDRFYAATGLPNDFAPPPGVDDW